jgi:hypothetical protein
VEDQHDEVGHPRTSQDGPDRVPLAHPHVHRPDAEIVYLPADHVLSFAEREGATSFDANGFLALAALEDV